MAASHSPLAYLAAALLGSGAIAHAAVPVSAKDAEFFEKHVRPVLINRCYECHSTQKKIKGGLALDSRSLLQKGGDSGAVIVAGQPDKSKFIEAVRWSNRDLQMPPKSALPAAELKALEQWVAMGAPDPREDTPAATKIGRVIDIAKGREFWSFKPISTQPLPAVRDTAWVKSPIDAFILAKLEQNGLSPSPPAEKRALIRRATFDLTGLPPTPEDVAAFLADDSTDAFSRVIERLLASPQYGERWARHWLDVARYADSNGLDENVALGHAWRYRDYVVNAFNSDKPYDQFLIEQLAGDLLPGADVETLTATGFLSLGAKVLAEPDMRKLEMDIIDEQLDTLGKAFLGMTFGCVRCHDHKFDPIRQDDYYALAAIFRSTRSLSDHRTGAIKFWFEHSLATPEQLAAKKRHEELAAKKKAEVTAFINKARAALKTELQAKAADYLAAAALLEADATFAEVEKLAAAKGLRPRYLLTCRQYLAKNREHPVFEKWHSFTAQKQPEAIRAHYRQLFSDAIAAAAQAKAAKAAEPPPTAKVPPKPKKKAAEKAEPAYTIADPALAAADAALNDIAGFLAIPDKDEHAFDAATFAKIAEMSDGIMNLEDQTPDPPSLMGVADGNITRSLPIHIRGSYLSLGKEVERGYPEVMQVSLAKPVMPAKQSGRLELARWMASGEHPLTARVMANRVWRWHFGQGIVSTPDNFGTLGGQPSHPELLDWLARYFVQEGWSVKDLHRLIMRSSAYQQSSNPEPTARGAVLAAAGEESVLVNERGTFKVSTPTSDLPNPSLIDPENRLLWRFNLQRLEAEQIRDAMLFVGGGLDQHIGGKTVPLRNREFVFNHTSRDHTKYESARRALYLPIIRNHLYDMLEQFDYPDPTMPTGSRNSTTVAPQALIMLNSPVAMDSAARLRDRLKAEHPAADPTPRIVRAYELLYSRSPSTAEIERARAFITDAADVEAGWLLLCQTLLAANEFIFLR